jgi:glycosyltransferase involved in cell wall biosynthesis
MNGGVSSAIIDLAISNPKQEHILIWRNKSDSPKPDNQDLQDIFHSTYILRHSLLSSIFQLRKLSNQLKPDIIHLHSSKAGFIGRVLPRKFRVFYSSHGFAFQRQDIPELFQFFFLQIERLLRNKTDTYIAFWPLDFELARTQVEYRKVKFYRSELLRDFPKKANSHGTVDQRLFISSARVAKAKDPGFLVEALQLLRLSSDSDFDISTFPKFIWVGLFGDEKRNSKMFTKMEKVGITLVPWKKNKELQHDLSVAEATIITSAWESGPMTFYESLRAGTPVLMRDIPAVSIFNFSKYQSPENLRLGILKHLQDPTFRNTALVEQITAVNTYLNEQRLTDEIYT